MNTIDVGYWFNYECLYSNLFCFEFAGLAERRSTLPGLTRVLINQLSLRICLYGIIERNQILRGLFCCVLNYLCFNKSNYNQFCMAGLLTV